MADTQRPTHEQIAALLRGIQERFGWQPIIENGNIIGLLQDGQSVTLEPGGQFELSGATVDTLHKTCAEVNSHLYQVRCRGRGRQQGQERRQVAGCCSSSGGGDRQAEAAAGRGAAAAATHVHAHAAQPANMTAAAPSSLFSGLHLLQCLMAMPDVHAVPAVP
jgi:hypothetical protein